MSEEVAGLEAAKYIADLGGHCIPAYVDRFDEKRPLVKDWVNAGTRDYKELEGMWDRHSYAWPGVVTRPGGLIVFDLDGKAATDWFRELSTSAGGVGKGAFIYRTPGRDTGCHIWYKWPGYLASIHKAEYRESGWTGGAELRGVGCWTLWAGARRKTGEYELLQTPSELAELPRSLWLAFTEKAEQQVTGGGPSGDLRELSPEAAFSNVWTDGRKQAVAGLIWHQLLRSGGDWDDEVLNMALRFAEEQCSPPLDAGIVRRKFEYTRNRIEGIRARQQEELGRWNNSINKLFG